jgi:hypothetical protein
MYVYVSAERSEKIAELLIIHHDLSLDKNCVISREA